MAMKVEVARIVFGTPPVRCTGGDVTVSYCITVCVLEYSTLRPQLPATVPIQRWLSEGTVRFLRLMKASNC
jgi:hypothetical protein